MLAYVIAILFLLVAYLVNNWLIKPRREIAHYVDMFKRNGFKVIQLPYIPLESHFFDEVHQDIERKKDPFYSFKRVYPTTDILVGNVLNKPQIVVMNPDILKEMMSPGKVMILPKEKKLA